MTPVIGEPREQSGLIDPIDVLVRHHSTRLHLVVLRIILDEHQIFRARNSASSSQEINPAVINRTVHRAGEIIGGSWRPYEQEVVVRSATWMGDFAGPLSMVIFGRGVVLAVREGGQGLQTMRREWIAQRLRI